MVVADGLDTPGVQRFYLRLEHVQALGELRMNAPDATLSVEGPAEAALGEHRDGLCACLGNAVSPSLSIEVTRQPHRVLWAVKIEE